MESVYRIVQLANGVRSVRSVAHAETFHPVIGPVAEAEALYVRQLGLPGRLRQHAGEFVIWDVGLGAAANAVTVLRATADIGCEVRLLSFDHTIAPLEFALRHAEDLAYFSGYERPLGELLRKGEVRFQDGARTVHWTLRVADFPSVISSDLARAFPKPHAILFDAYSPAKNPEMWTQPLFAGIYELLDPSCPCALPTYSRSTMLRVSLLLAGFYVGAGHATGEKEQTTIAANTPDLITHPLGRDWLARAERSTSAEPLWEGSYRQAPLALGTARRLREHPQFKT